MLRATKDIMLPTTITGSLPRPSWYTQNLGMRSFLDAMVNNQFREQYVDTVGIYLHEQEMAGLDIVTDGDAHFDSDVGGQSWTNYPPRHMGGFDKNPQPTPAGKGGLMFPPGHILHDYLESRVMPGINGPVTRGDLQYAAMWKVAQRMTKKPVKFGTIGPELVAFAVQDKHYKSIKDRILAISDALNQELTELADAGCQVIQFEEPQIHMLAIRQGRRRRDQSELQRRGVQSHREGPARQDRGVVPHLLGQPVAAAHVQEVQSYKDALETLNKVDADVITFEIGQRRRHGPGGLRQGHHADKKIAIGVIDHHTLQVERPEEIADHIRRALKYIPAERLVISSDCGMGREGMSRRHALLQDGVAGARHQYRAQGARAAAGRVPRRRPALFPGCAKRLTGSRCYQKLNASEPIAGIDLARLRSV